MLTSTKTFDQYCTYVWEQKQLIAYIFHIWFTDCS